MSEKSDARRASFLMIAAVTIGGLLYRGEFVTHGLLDLMMLGLFMLLMWWLLGPTRAETAEEEQARKVGLPPIDKLDRK